MRHFDSLSDAIREIRRDLFKSPIVISNQVQGHKVEMKAHEAMNYGFSVPCETVPETPKQLIELARDSGLTWYQGLTPQEEKELTRWMVAEYNARVFDNPDRQELTELMHPVLGEVAIEGQHPSYTYGERTFGMVPTLEQMLRSEPDNRRAFWPIYNPVDALRAGSRTRVPCT